LPDYFFFVHGKNCPLTNDPTKITSTPARQTARQRDYKELETMSNDNNDNNNTIAAATMLGFFFAANQAKETPVLIKPCNDNAADELIMKLAAPRV